MDGCGCGVVLETPYHFYMECERWQKHREAFELNVLDCHRISSQMKEYLGRMGDNKQRWYELMMCCEFGEPLHKVYRMPVSELKKIITRALGGHEPSKELEKQARVALRDKLDLQSIWDRAVVLWYGERQYAGHAPKMYGGDAR